MSPSGPVAGMPLHRLAEPLAFLVGDWVGEGRGTWTPSFSYADSLSARHDGRPLVELRQVTRAADGAPSHSELAYLLVKEGGIVHMVVAEPSGVAEALTGSVSDNVLELASVEIAHTPGSKPVTQVTRRYFLDAEGCLVAEVAIGLGGEPAAAHTRSVLRRTGEATGG